MKIPLKEYGELLVKYLKPQWLKVLLLAILMFGSVGLALISPQIIRQFIDNAISGGKLDGLLWIALLFIGVALVQQVVAAFSAYVGEDVGWTATNALRADLALHCLQLDMTFHNERTPGEFIERIDGDITAISTFFSQFILKVIQNIILLISVLVLLFVEDWRVGLALTIFSIIAMFVLVKSRNLAVPATVKERQASAELFGFVEERLAGLNDLRANGGGAYTMRRYYQVARELLVKARYAWMFRSLTWLLTMSMFAIGYVIAFGMGAFLYFSGAITIGTVYIFFQYTEMLRAPLEQITDQMQVMQKASAGFGRVRELYFTRSKIEDKAVTTPLPHEGALSVEFRNVSFGYESDALTLQNVSFRLQPGKVLGLVGRTGSGKTTITRLLFRLYDPQHGSVRVGGVDIRDAAQAELRHRIGIVTQEVQLFHASVRDNLTFFDRTIPDGRILQVIADLGLGGWYAALPDGLDTELSAGGGGLSAGEAQLLAFTRIFLRNPGLVILDEPSSRLDPVTEALIEQAVVKLLQDRTVLIIAHRLATVQRADEIMVLDGGQVLEHDFRDRLAANPNSRFYHLLQTGMEEVLV